MADDAVASGSLPPAYLATGGSSFVEFLQAQAADLLPWHRHLAAPVTPGDIPHGTTVLALGYADGVIMAGDRRGTSGNLISQSDLEKVCPADDFTAVAFAGSVAIALELIKLFQVELEHYEKIEGVTLSLAAKINRLGAMVRANVDLALQGLAMLPLLAGYDLDSGVGRIFSMDVMGAISEERDYAAIGSGSQFAKASMKKLYRPGVSERQAARVCVEALYDAAEEDTATGGPDLVRDIFPTLATVTAAGYREYPTDEAAATARTVVEGRHANQGGPRAVLP